MNSDSNDVESLAPDPTYLLKLAKAVMPYGKYAGVRLVNLPEPYVVWFSRKGFPKGELGEMLKNIYEIKVNGLEYLFKPLMAGNTYIDNNSL
jgi:uncharacterized protein (DUF3820 family)